MNREVKVPMELTEGVSASGLIHNDSIREVGVAVELRLLSVDDASEVFKVSLLIHTHYDDPDFVKKDGRKQNGYERVDDYEGYLPSLVMVNCTETQFEEFVQVTRVNYHTGVVWTAFYNTCVISESLELEKFPFDRQLFRVIFKSANAKLRPWKVDNKVLDFLPMQGRALQDEDKVNAVYLVACELKNWFMARFKVTYFPDDDDPASLTQGEFEIAIMAERDPKFYFFNFYLIIYLIVLTNVALLSIDPVDSGDRNAVTITLLLTLVAFKFVLMEGTPKVGYLTYMDMYVVSSFVFTIIAVFENIFISPLVQCQLSSEADCDDLETLSLGLREKDAFFQIAFAAIWTVLNLIVTVTCFWPSLLRDSWDSVLSNQIGETDQTVQRTRMVMNNGNGKIVQAQDVL